MKNGKLTIVLDLPKEHTETARVYFNERSFEVTAYCGMNVLEQVVAAAFRSCVSTVPKDQPQPPPDESVEF